MASDTFDLEREIIVPMDAELTTSETARTLLPRLRTRFDWRDACLVSSRGASIHELTLLKEYIRGYFPVLIGVSEGAELIVTAGYIPSVIVGDLRLVSDGTLTLATDVVVRVDAGGQAPGLVRALELGIDPILVRYDGAVEILAMAAIADTEGLTILVGYPSIEQLLLERVETSSFNSSPEDFIGLGTEILSAQAVAELYKPRLSTYTVVAFALIAIATAAVGIALIFTSYGLL